MTEEGERKGASNIPSGSYECTEFLVIGSFIFFPQLFALSQFQNAIVENT